MRSLLLVVSLTGACLSATSFAADPESGERIFKRCAVCHSVGEDAKPGVGPVLNGLLGRKAGTYAGFKYTEANKNSGFTWDEATLANYLKNPRAAIPGTSMAFPGLRKEEEIQDLIAYLKRFDPDGKPTQ